MIEANGLDVSIGELCRIRSSDGNFIRAEVVGFKDNVAQLMPLAEVFEIKMGAEVIPSQKQVNTTTTCTHTFNVNSIRSQQQPHTNTNTKSTPISTPR